LFDGSLAGDCDRLPSNRAKAKKFFHGNVIKGAKRSAEDAIPDIDHGIVRKRADHPLHRNLVIFHGCRPCRLHRACHKSGTGI
jgi:hypothetical protein